MISGTCGDVEEAEKSEATSEASRVKIDVVHELELRSGDKGVDI